MSLLLFTFIFYKMFALEILSFLDAKSVWYKCACFGQAKKSGIISSGFYEMFSIFRY